MSAIGKEVLQLRKILLAGMVQGAHYIVIDGHAGMNPFLALQIFPYRVPKVLDFHANNITCGYLFGGS